MTDKANVLSGGATPTLVTDGPCLVGTLENLKAGVGAKPMSEAALVKVRSDAFGLLDKIVRAYCSNVASGEVGAGGSKVAGPKLLKEAPTGLLYGRVQSGKTVAMITLTAAAIDNGFRVVVVLTSDNVKLVEQTSERFTALEGALIKDSNTADTWEGDTEHIKKHIADNGVVFICTKNQQRLTALVEFLGKVGASEFPALVLDDEADQATLDTTVRARKAGKKGEKERSAIHKIAVMDPESGQSIRQTLRHHVFVQVTATPYALLLQNIDSELRPVFNHLLEPGKGYTGGEAFFDAPIVENEKPPLVFVAEDEWAQIEAQTEGPPPLGLQQAIAFFLVGSGAQSLLDPAAKANSQNFLCHTSQKTSEHDRLANLIRAHVNQIWDDLKKGGSSETMLRLHWAYDQLAATLPNRPDFDDILGRIKQRLPQREVPVINSASGGGNLARRLNFIVGGNILGRGLTIENLLVTYYLRRAKISQMDTVLQHARMYGYREALMPFTRVFLPEDLAARFHFIHTAEQNLRRQLSSEDALSKLSVETMAQLRATRLNVLDTSNLAAYEPGQHVYPQRPALEKNAKKAADRAAQIERALKRVIGDALPASEFVPVEREQFIELLKLMPVSDEDADFWDAVMFERVLVRVKAHWTHGFIYFREMSRRGSEKSKGTFPTGAFSGDELALARSKSGPVLGCFRDDGKKLPAANGLTFWYPSLVFPSNMPTQVFNLTARNESDS